jgi:hypothetical protein
LGSSRKFARSWGQKFGADGGSNCSAESQLGLRETQLRMEQKRIDKLMRASSTTLRVMKGEARNQF